MPDHHPAHNRHNKHTKTHWKLDRDTSGGIVLDRLCIDRLRFLAQMRCVECWIE